MSMLRGVIFISAGTLVLAAFLVDAADKSGVLSGGSDTGNQSRVDVGMPAEGRLQNVSQSTTPVIDDFQPNSAANAADDWGGGDVDTAPSPRPASAQRSQSSNSSGQTLDADGAELDASHFGRPAVSTPPSDRKSAERSLYRDINKVIDKRTRQ